MRDLFQPRSSVVRSDTSRLVDGQRKHDHNTDNHHDSLHHVGPDDRVETTVGGVQNHCHTEDDQTNQILIALGTENMGPVRQTGGERRERVDRPEQSLENCAATLELCNQVERHEEHNQGDCHQPEGNAAEAVSQNVGDGDGTAGSSHLVDTFAQQAHHTDGHHHVAADPESQAPTVSINFAREAHEAAAG